MSASPERLDSPEELDSQTRWWCAGLPLEERRPLADLERTLLSRAARRALGRFTLSALAALAWLGGVFPLGDAMGRADRLTESAGIAVYFGWMLGLGLWLAWTNDAFRAWRRRVRDIEAGELLVFEGPMPAEDRLRREPLRLARMGFLRPGPLDHRRLVVLAGSRQVWARNDRGQDRFADVWVHQVAALPEYAYRVPVSPEQLRVVSHPELRFQKRVLSEAELDELRDYVSRLRRPDPGQWFAAVLLLLLLAELLGPGVPASPPLKLVERLFRDLMFLAVVMMASVRYWSRLRFANGLARDVQIGWALSVDPESVEPMPNHASDHGESALDADLPEFLAHSGALWIHHGRPAPWRVLRRAA